MISDLALMAVLGIGSCIRITKRCRYVLNTIDVVNMFSYVQLAACNLVETNSLHKEIIEIAALQRPRPD